MTNPAPRLTKNDLRSPAVILFCTVYVFAVVLTLFSDPLQALVYVVMSLSILMLIWLILDLTKELQVPDVQIKRPWPELLLVCTFFIVIRFTPYLTFGDKWALGEIVRKEFLYVVLPLAALRWYGNSFTSLGFSLSNWKQNLKVGGIVLACMAVPCVFLISDTAKLIASGAVSLLQGTTAYFLYFIHNTLRSGFPEEFFYRAVLQTRLSYVFKSRLGSILLVSLLFGLVHIPNYRELPLLEAFCNAFFLQGIAGGLLFGVIWERTRSLLPGVLVHSGINALTNVGDAVSMFFQ